MSNPLLLASASPRRKELLCRVGISVQVLPARVDETPHPGELAIPYARRIALCKATKIAEQQPHRWVLGADTVVEVNGTPMGKAESPAHAAAMLESLSGREHRVTTAICLAGAGEVYDESVTTVVRMRTIAEWELEQYLAAGEWQGKAGAYAIQGMAQAFVTEVRGSVSNVVGLPLSVTLDLLQKHASLRPDYRRGTPS